MYMQRNMIKIIKDDSHTNYVLSTVSISR